MLASLDVDLRQFWNENELNALLKDFRSNELSAPEPKLDQAAELQKKWKTERGQIWQIGEHRLMCGDSRSASDVSELMDGKIAKLCATDPPYLVSYDAKNHPSKDFSDGKNKDWKERYADKQKSEPLGPFYEAFLRLALDVCEADAAIYVWHASQRQVEVEQAMRNCGILVHQVRNAGRADIEVMGLPKPGNFPIGSSESRAAARAQLERSKQPKEVISVRVIHVGHDGKEPLPPPQRHPWPGGVTEIMHVAGSSS